MPHKHLCVFYGKYGIMASFALSFSGFTNLALHLPPGVFIIMEDIDIATMSLLLYSLKCNKKFTMV
jgi:hypothetical protein